MSHEPPSDLDRLQASLQGIEEAIQDQTKVISELHHGFHTALAEEYLERAVSAERKWKELDAKLRNLAGKWKKANCNTSFDVCACELLSLLDKS
jgi:DNA-binding GntR family transcriptional regulator